jgi:hypothetical protein
LPRQYSAGLFFQQLSLEHATDFTVTCETFPLSFLPAGCVILPSLQLQTKVAGRFRFCDYSEEKKGLKREAGSLC